MRRVALALAVGAALLPAACGSSGDDGSSTTGGGAAAANVRVSEREVLQPRPLPAWLRLPPIEEVKARSIPNGYRPVWWNTVRITPQEVEQVRRLRLKAAFLNWSNVLYNQTIASGLKDALDVLGIDLVAETNFALKSSGVSGDLRSVLPLKPDVIFTGGTIDPSQAAAQLQPAVDAGVRLVLFANGADGWEIGPDKQIASLIAYDPYQLGASVADSIHEQYPDGAKIGYIHWVTNVKIVNQRDQGFLDQVARYPNLRIVARQDMPDPNQGQTQAAAMITKTPDIDVIYAPWEDPPAVGIAAALRAKGRDDVKIATMDLGTQGASDIAHDGFIFADSGEDVYDWGRTAGIVAGLDALGKEVPPYILTPVFGVTRRNLDSGWDFMHGPHFPLPERDRIPGS